MTTQILIADDEPAVRQLLELVLRTQGYEVLAANNGDQLIRMAQEIIPDLVIVDLMMPQMDGYEAIRQLRNDTRTAHIPMLILTAKSSPDDVVSGFETGADDYITKPFNIPELLARIKGHLRRAAQMPVSNPLTGLPGNILLTEEIKHRLKGDNPFALLYIDLDNFKAFNDTYGPARGDRVIRLVADILVELTSGSGNNDFIGHIGGDDFAMLTTPEQIDPICSQIIARFDERVRTLYDAEDLERGFLQGVDRQGVPRHFPITSLSIGVVTNLYRSFADHEEVTRVAAEMKRFAKQQPISNYAVDVRSTDDQVIDRERRQSILPIILIVSPDDALRQMMVGGLRNEGYRVFEVAGEAELHALLAQEYELALVIADTRTDALVWQPITTLQQQYPATEVLAITTREHNEPPGLSSIRHHSLPMPFRIEQLVDLVASIIPQHDR
ncbi:MAG TPA: response regulator [Roseiflexaceae bacterium]|nr:response regulator [Roseiflexaceae bacterium]